VQHITPTSDSTAELAVGEGLCAPQRHLPQRTAMEGPTDLGRACDWSRTRRGQALAPFGACVARARGTPTPRTPGCTNATPLVLLSNTRQRSLSILCSSVLAHTTCRSPHLSITFIHLMIALRRFCPKSMAVTTPLCLPRRARAAGLTIGFARQHTSGRSAVSPSEDSTRQCCETNQQTQFRTECAKSRPNCPLGSGAIP
jgi:hypothetical protein